MLHVFNDLLEQKVPLKWRISRLNNVAGFFFFLIFALITFWIGKCQRSLCAIALVPYWKLKMKGNWFCIFWHSFYCQWNFWVDGRSIDSQRIQNYYLYFTQEKGINVRNGEKNSKGVPVISRNFLFPLRKLDPSFSHFSQFSFQFYSLFCFWRWLFGYKHTMSLPNIIQGHQ